LEVGDLDKRGEINLEDMKHEVPKRSEARPQVTIEVSWVKVKERDSAI
jgi:hypothetical protein